MAKRAANTGAEQIDDELPLNDNEMIDELAGMFEESDLLEDEDDGDEDLPPVQEDEDEGDADEEDEGDEDDDVEEDLKVSIRINGKKADLATLLKETNHYPVVGGKELEVGYEELVKGYQRGKDYTEKTTELKQQKAEMQPYVELVAYAKHDPQFVQYVQHYFKHGAHPEAASNPDLTVPDTELAEMMDETSEKYDPHRASQIMKARREYLSKRQQRQPIDQKAQEEIQTRWKEWAEAETEVAKEKIAELGGDLDKDVKDVAKTLQAIGFKDEEIMQLADSRMVMTAWAAAQYFKSMSKGDAPSARLGAKRRKLAAPRVAGVGQGKQGSSKTKRQRDTLRKAMSTQRDDDWVDAIASRLNL